jgi:hypothetical protein
MLVEGASPSDRVGLKFFIYQGLLSQSMTGSASPIWRLEGLGAIGPEPSLRDELMLFGQFVGDWEIVECRYLEDGKWVRRTGEVHWNWILDGRAVQDVWLYHDVESGGLRPTGTTIRYYDPERRLWRSIWITPKHNDVDLFLGKKVGDEIVLDMQEESKKPGDGEIRWIFSEITPNSFGWRAEESMDGGKTWVTDTVMKVVRLGTKGTSFSY